MRLVSFTPNALRRLPSASVHPSRPRRAATAPASCPPVAAADPPVSALPTPDAPFSIEEFVHLARLAGAL